MNVQTDAPTLTPVAFMGLFEEFRATSWDGWRAILARLTPTVRELYCIAGRGSGKSRLVAVIASCFGDAGAVVLTNGTPDGFKTALARRRRR